MAEIIAHELYIKACAETLEVADISNTDWTAEDDSPRTGSIDLAPSATAFAYGDDTAALLWDEERGWAIAWGEPNETHHDAVVDLFTGDLPTPVALVDYVKAALAVKPRLTTSVGRYRSAGAEDDFDQRLAAYAE